VTCAFCEIARDPSQVAVVYQDTELLAFLDRMPIREGHTMVIPRAHYDYLDDMPAELAARAMILAQRIARVMKPLYGVERVGFVATGGDLPHAHMHIVPMHEKTDITSACYMAEPPVFAEQPLAPKAVLDPVAARLATALERTR